MRRLLLMATIAGLGIACASRVVPGDSAPAILFAADPALVDASLEAYRRIDDLPALPDDATHVYVQRESTIDGHITLLRYTSARGASAAVCDGVCVDAHHVDAPPALLPTAEELHAPSWYTAPTGPGHVIIDAVPTTSQIGGEQVPCGFSRARGHGVFRSGTTITMLDWSIQWFRFGCGG